MKFEISGSETKSLCTDDKMKYAARKIKSENKHKSKHKKNKHEEKEEKALETLHPYATKQTQQSTLRSLIYIVPRCVI